MDSYITEQKKIQKILQETPGQISFMINIWISPTIKTFMVITAHFIDKEWKLQNIIVDFIQVCGAHTGENIKKHL